jgi:cytidylate kinase
MIIISGYDCSGKTTLAGRIASPADIILEAGAVVRKEFGLQRGPDLTQIYTANLHLMNQKIVSEAVFLQAGLLSPWSAVIVVGVRSISLHRDLVAQCPQATSFFLDVPRRIRYFRHIAARRIAVPMSYGAFVANDLAQRAWGIEEVKRAATYILKTNRLE